MKRTENAGNQPTTTVNNNLNGKSQLMLKTENEIISIHLGPAWFIENQDIQIAPKDKIRVKGSRITFDGKPALVAAEVKKGDAILTLRDAKGMPVWAGWRRR